MLVGKVWECGRVLLLTIILPRLPSLQSGIQDEPTVTTSNLGAANVTQLPEIWLRHAVNLAFPVANTTSITQVKF